MNLNWKINKNPFVLVTLFSALANATGWIRFWYFLEYLEFDRFGWKLDSVGIFFGLVVYRKHDHVCTSWLNDLFVHFAHFFAFQLVSLFADFSKLNQNYTKSIAIFTLYLLSFPTQMTKYPNPPSL